MEEVPCIFKKLESLSLLFGDKKPDMHITRGMITVYVVYTLADELGSGLGVSWEEEYAVGFIFVVWNEEGDGTSSNHREF